MTRLTLEQAPVLVVGAGIMGAGIAQVAAQAGHPVFLFDARAGAAAEAKSKLLATLQSLVAKGRLSDQAAQDCAAKVEPISELAQASGVQLAIEAIVENLDAKQSLMRSLESLLPAEAILATNTSSISVTAIASGLQHPERVVGMHFFNPVPLMKLVEVVSGLQTDRSVAETIFALSQHWGKVPVYAKSTPGFIVNRIARPYYAETLALLQEQAAEPAVLDACLQAAGFRMGPCELMDLIGHDTNFAVTQSVYEANFFDKRYVPSLVQRELVAGGLLGRKTSHGFYRYPRAAHSNSSGSAAATDTPFPPTRVSVHGNDPIANDLATRLSARWGGVFERILASDWCGIEIDTARLMLSDGRCASDIAAQRRRQQASADIAVFDRFDPALASLANQTPSATTTPGRLSLAYACAEGASDHWQHEAPSWLNLLGFEPVRLTDVPGLIVTRTLAMLINEAADAVNQGVCSPEGADAAMKLGVNYPGGPFEWLANWSAQAVSDILIALDAVYGGERYRVSPWLRRRASSEIR